jgi:hypothetical protein
MRQVIAQAAELATLRQSMAQDALLTQKIQTLLVLALPPAVFGLRMVWEFGIIWLD